MGTTIQLGDVHTWYDEHGTGEALVLLHGALLDARCFDSNIEALAERFRVYLPERRGHGRTPDVPGPFTFDRFVQETIDFIEAVPGGPVHLAGHSHGAFTALKVAIARPDLVNRLVLISGGFSRSGYVPGADAHLEVDQVVRYLGPAYGQVSPDGQAHFPVVVEKVAELADVEPDFDAAELLRVRSRTLVMSSDDDLMSLAHVGELYRTIPVAELAIVPGTSHFLLQEKPDLCNRILLDFLTLDPVPLVTPMLRAPSPTA